MSEILPPSVALARPAGAAEVFRAVRALDSGEEGLLSLWLLHAAGDDIEYGRLAAVWSLRIPGAASTAVRLWLMERDYADLGIANTLLGALERDIVEQGRWPNEYNGVVVGFLKNCLANRAPSIRAAVLSVLCLAAKRGTLGDALPKQYGLWLANAVPGATSDFADEEELSDVRMVQAAIRAPTSVVVFPFATRALQRVVLDLLDLQDRTRDVVGPLDNLINHVRRRQLLDDASRQAERGGVPVQTLRVLSERASTRVVQAFVSYGEAIVALWQDPDFSEVTAPDYGTEVGWAPAASVPFHLYFGADESRQAFDVLECLVTLRGPAQRRELLETLDPTIAGAVLRFLGRLAQHDGELELVLTDPASPDWQRSLILRSDSVSDVMIRGLAQRANALERDAHVVVHKDHVPQANTVHQVFQAVDAMVLRGAVTPDDIDDVNSDRQVNYYKHGARTLGLFDDDNRPTDRARALEALSENKRLALTAVYFEDAPIGRAWRAWAGKGKLKDVDPQTAQAFLEECVRGLSGTTPKRRASTLRTWFSELMSHYPT